MTGEMSKWTKLIKVIREVLIWLCTWPMRAIYRLLGLRYFYTALQSVNPTAQLFRAARNTLYVVGGELNADVWNTKPVREALSELTSRANPPEIKIIFGPRGQANQHTLRCLLSMMREGKLELYEVPERRERHFAVVDGLYVKIEEPHLPNAQVRSGYVDYHNRELAAELTASMFPGDPGMVQLVAG